MTIRSGAGNPRSPRPREGIPIGHDPGLNAGRRLADDALDLVPGPYRDGRLGDDYRGSGQRIRDLARGAVHIAEVGMAVAAARRRSHRDEDRAGAVDRAAEIGGEAEPLAVDVAGDELLSPLEDGHDAPFERLDLAGVLVDANDLVAEVRKTGAGDPARHGQVPMMAMRMKPPREAGRAPRYQRPPAAT